MLVSTLKSATKDLEARARQSPSKKLPEPPPLPYFGELPAEVASKLVNDFFSSRMRFALSTTCSAWRVALWHPGYWYHFHLPSFTNNTSFGNFLDRHTQRWQRTTCVTFSIAGSFIPSETQLRRLLSLAPSLVELKLTATDAPPKPGDQWMSRLATLGIGDRLEALSFLNIRLSSYVTDRYLTRLGEPIPITMDFDDEYGVEVQDGGSSSSEEPARKVNRCFPKLRKLEVFGLPPILLKDHVNGSRSYRARLGAAEAAAVEIAQGCPTLQTLRLVNPSQPGTSFEVDVRAAREKHASDLQMATTPAIDETRHSVFLATLPKLSNAMLNSNKRVLEQVHRDSLPWDSWGDTPKLW